MTGDELIIALQALPPEVRARPVAYMDEVWLREVRSVTLETENVYGTQPDTPSHSRLDGESLTPPVLHGDEINGEDERR